MRADRVAVARAGGGGTTVIGTGLLLCQREQGHSCLDPQIWIMAHGFGNVTTSPS